MGLMRKVVKKSVIVILPLAALSFLISLEGWGLRLVRLFGNPDLMPGSVILGGVIGLANIKGLVWGIERLLGTHKADAKLVFLSLFRLFILFAIIIALAAMKLINLLGFLIGMTAVFIVLIIEAVNIAKGKE
jgi:hypothetical protein